MQSVSACSCSYPLLAWEANINRPKEDIPLQQELCARSNIDVAASRAEMGQTQLLEGKISLACFQYLKAADALHILSPQAHLYQMGTWEETSLFYHYLDQAIEAFQKTEEPDRSELLSIFRELTVCWMEHWKKENRPDNMQNLFFLKMANLYIKLPTSQLTVHYALRTASAFGGDQQRSFIYFRHAVDTCLQLQDEQTRTELLYEIIENAFLHYRTFANLNSNIAAFWVQLVELHREKISNFTAAHCLSLAAHCYSELHYDQKEGFPCDEILPLQKIDALAIAYWLDAIALFQNCLQNEHPEKNEALIKRAITVCWHQLIDHFLEAPRNPFLRQRFASEWFFDIAKQIATPLHFSFFATLQLLNYKARQQKDEVAQIAKLLQTTFDSLNQEEILKKIGHLHTMKSIKPNNAKSLRITLEWLLNAKPSS